jgi:hypothetical protein
MATTTPNNGWSVPTSSDYVAQGAVAIETLGDAIDASVGTGLLTWTNYTPTWTNLTLGNGTLTAKYAKLGKTVYFYVKFVMGSTSAVGNSPKFTLPVTPLAYWFNHDWRMFIEDSGVNSYLGGAQFDTLPNLLTLHSHRADTTYVSYGTVSSATPMTWGTNDNFIVSGIYETA